MRLYYLCGDRGIAPDGTKGASIHLRSLAEALRALGHEVVLFSRRAGEGPPGLEVVPFMDERSVLEHAERHGPPDAILERYSLALEAGLDAARQLDTGYVLEMNSPLVEEAARYRDDERDSESERIEDRLLREADAVACVSEPLARYVRTRGERRERVVVVRNGHHPRLFESTGGGESRSRSENLRIGFLGHPKPWHGADRLPAILARCLDRGVEAEIVIIGGGAMSEAILEEAACNGHRDRLRVTGPVEHARAIEELSRCDVSIAPYPRSAANGGGTPEATGFFYFCPIKVIESMAAGVPVVASDLGDIRAIVDDGGFVVSADDDTAFANALAMLARDPDGRLALGAAGRRRAREHFTWERSARSIVELVEASIGARRKR